MPMVEPEVLMDGNHDIDLCYEVTEATLRSLFGALYEHNVMLEGTILKASMVISGKNCEQQASREEVAEATVRCLKSTVPAMLPGIVFLSGGQSDEDATAHLNAMNQMGPHPWPLSFSYGRAMQQAALQAVGRGHARQLRRGAEDRRAARTRKRPGLAGPVGRLIRRSTTPTAMKKGGPRAALLRPGRGGARPAASAVQKRTSRRSVVM